jgi:hypothetical protein
MLDCDDSHHIGQSYYILKQPKPQFSDDGKPVLRGLLCVWNPEVDRENFTSLIHHRIADPTHGEIACCWQIVNDEACLIYRDESRGQVTRHELRKSAKRFSDYLDDCLKQLSQNIRIRHGWDDKIIRRYLGLSQ